MKKGPQPPQQGRLFKAEEASPEYAAYKQRRAELGLVNHQQFSFLVEWSHDKDTLKEGQVVSGRSLVTTQGRNELDARLAAEQMVAARGREPTRARPWKGLK